MESADSTFDCDACMRQILEMRENNLPAAAALSRHLASCSRCRSELAWDDELRTRLEQEALSSSNTDLCGRVRRRLRGQARRANLAWVAAASLALVAGMLLLPSPTHVPLRSVTSVPPSDIRVEPASDIPGSIVLFAAPPVDSLDLLARQQAAYLDVLGHPEKE